MKVEQILNFIDSGDIALPEFQRGYVWNRNQVRGLFTSLYRSYPVGGFMTWNTAAEGAAARGGISTDGTIKLLLDGQQRATSLYGVIRGQAPKFFEGNPAAFTDLYFNVVDETFEFYAPAKMKNDPAWIGVSALMTNGVGGLVTAMQTLAGGDALFATYFGRVNAIAEIQRREMHIEEVTGPDKTIDVVVTSSTGSTPAAPSSPRATWRLPRSAPPGPTPVRSSTTRWTHGGKRASISSSTGCFVSSTPLLPARRPSCARSALLEGNMRPHPS